MFEVIFNVGITFCCDGEENDYMFGVKFYNIKFCRRSYKEKMLALVLYYNNTTTLDFDFIVKCFSSKINIKHVENIFTLFLDNGLYKVKLILATSVGKKFISCL